MVSFMFYYNAAVRVYSDEHQFRRSTRAYKIFSSDLIKPLIRCCRGSSSVFIHRHGRHFYNMRTVLLIGL